MPTIVFNDAGWTIMTSSWTAGSADQNDHVSLHYLWVSAMSSQECACSITLPLTMEQFSTAVTSAREAVVDLRALQNQRT